MSTVESEVAAQVRLHRHYRVAPDQVWRAWTEPQALSRWFGHPGEGRPATVAEIDLRVGGTYRLTFEGRTGETNVVSGVYQEVVPLRRLVFTWAWQSTPERVSRVVIDLLPVDQGQGTDLTFVHDRFFDAAARDNHDVGWQSGFATLDALLAPGGGLA